MSWQWWTVTVFGGLALAWGAFLLFLVLAGRRTDARALAGFIPD